MFRRILPMLAVLLAAPSAFAAVDLTVTITPPAAHDVDTFARYNVTVTNLGGSKANSAVVQIDLPETANSPTSYVMGSLGAVHSKCSASGASVVCNLGRLRGNRSTSVWFEMALPASVMPMTFSAEASFSGTDQNPANDVAVLDADLTYVDTAVSAPASATVTSCTGQGLSGFYECTLAPGSTMTHNVILEAGGTLNFPGSGGYYSGYWDQATPDQLNMTYLDNGDLAGVYLGYGVGGNCFEGLMVFFGTPWVAGYEVCL